MSVKVDFSGYVTRNDIKCTDGRTIKKNAFKHYDGQVVPLVWKHLTDDPENILGKVYLENRDDGVYGYGVLNNTSKAQTTKELLRHGDITNMSIHANNLVQRGGDVYHGDLVEVSLVTKGANPGAVIENVSIAHGDGSYTDIDDEAVIHHSGEIDNFGRENLEIDLYDDEEEDFLHEDDEKEDDDMTVEDVINSMNEMQRNVLYALVGAASEDGKSETKHSDEGGTDMKTNAFEAQGRATSNNELSHEDIQKIATEVFLDCNNNKTNFRDALRHAAEEYGIKNIEILFPDAKAVNNPPDFVKRRTEWVSTVLSGTKHTPFSRIKSRFADITADEARARGYLKGNKKIEEVFPVMQRTTTPQTIYKKQKLDRDDIIDITDFDVVAWLRAEMRVMLDEEIARAILIGDGRLITSPDKIKEENIRPIWTDDAFYSYKLQLDKDASLNDLADAFIRSRLYYEGAGRPVCFMAPETVTELMLQRDNDGKRMYKTEGELADALRVSKIIEVPLFYNQVRTDSAGDSKKYALKAILVNLNDYTVGADKGGQVSMFDDFDIDYNQYKYLIETRISGALTGYHSAVVIETETDGVGLAMAKGGSKVAV